MTRNFATAVAVAAAVCICAIATPLRAAGQQKQIPPELNGHAAVAEIVLPPELEVEKPATLAVIDSDGRLVEGVTVLLPGGRKVTTDATGRARFVVTSDPGAFIAEVAESALQPRVRAYSLVRAHPPENSAAASSGFTVSEYPHTLVHDQPVTVKGYGFRGDAELDGAIVGGKPAMVLAASPMGIVFQTEPGITPGPASLALQVAGVKHEPLAVTIVSLEISQPAGTVVVGKKEVILVAVIGTELKTVLAVQNLSPDVIDLPAGNFHSVVSTGGALNEASIVMRARRGGDYSVGVHVAPSTVDLGLVRRELMAARGLAEGAWVARMEAVLAQMDQLEHEPKGVARLQQEIEKMLVEQPPTDVNKHLQAAWLAVSQT
jgi:hypothetical protein